MPELRVKPGVPILNRAHPLAQGLVFALPLCERGGNPRDVAGAVAATNNSVAWANSIYGPCAVSAGTDTSYLSVASSAALEPAQLTVSVLAQVLAAGTWSSHDSGNDYFLAKGRDATTGFALGLAWRPSDGKITFLVNGGLAAVSSTRTFTLPMTPHLITGTYDLSTVRLYVDGVLEGSASYSSAIIYSQSDRSLRIGQWGLSAAIRATNSNFSNVLICNRALNASEIRALYLDPWAIYRVPSRKIIYSFVNSAVLFRRSQFERAGSRGVF